MIIHPPEIEYKNGQVVISARIENKHVVPAFPQRLWFSFPDIWETYLTERTDAFAFGMLPFAMLLNEPLIVRGTTSSQLAYGLQEYQEIFHLWFPKQFNKIEAEFEHLQRNTAQPIRNIAAVGSSFSGGIDSTFTLWHHLPENALNKDAQITHIVFIHGLNSDYQKEDLHKFARDNYAVLAKQLGLEFIEATCNTRDFIPWISHRLIYQGTLLGIPLALGNLFCRYYVPSDGHMGAYVIKRGSAPLLDHFASTETMMLIHHGWAYSRVEKIQALAGWEVAKKHLKVCDNPQFIANSYNCSACEKCTHTMNILAAIGELSNFHTFKPTIPFINYVNWGLKYEAETRGIAEPHRAFINQKRFQYLPLLWLTFIIAQIKTVASSTLPGKIKSRVNKMVYPVQ